ncbi:hypothetical protein K469DRAFT_659388 [Zopfia rhizophila CBS 207.26]|uniref:Uncharacterized protein n=1 Tax=Zopfia rhizophila CBS 207.26 TaxID=1314779 RepID=A0A6A6EGL4_9PEZI|nr:hypothetical protein K469DRAFT_659388 [Zopfia rhizophila CBS 207.26]
MSELDSKFVKRGLWVNWSHGPIMGQTITTDVRTGTIVVSFLAVLASIATVHLWHLITFFYHQRRARGHPSDGLFWQQQAILRTLPSPSSLMADSVKLWWCWRHRSNNTLARCFLLPFLALVFSLATLVATIFSSYVVDSSNIDVLDHVACPFAPSMCVGEELSAISMDTGLVDLNDKRGMNLKKSDRVQFRKKTTCGVLTLDGHSQIVNATNAPDLPKSYIQRPQSSQDPGEILALTYGGLRTAKKGDWENVTFSYSLAESNSTYRFLGVSRMAYLTPHPDWKGHFSPLSEIARKDADVALTTIHHNNIIYSNPVDDPVFAAHKPFKYVTGTGRNITMYMPDSPARTIGCTEQASRKYSRLENTTTANSPTVSILLQAGLIVEASPDKLPGANPTQIAVIQLLVSLIRDSDAKGYVDEPKTAGEKELCRAQKMRKAGGFANINVFGLVFIAVISCTIMILDIILLKFLVYLSRFRHALAPRLDRWIQDGVLQLQRRAYEAYGEGSWENLDEEIPVTTQKQTLSELPLTSLPVVSDHKQKLWLDQKHASTSESRFTEVDKGSHKSDEDDIELCEKTLRSPKSTRTWGTDFTHVEEGPHPEIWKKSSRFLHSRHI